MQKERKLVHMPNNKDARMRKLGLEDLQRSLKTIRMKRRFNAIIKILSNVKRNDYTIIRRATNLDISLNQSKIPCPKTHDKTYRNKNYISTMMRTIIAKHFRLCAKTVYLYNLLHNVNSCSLCRPSLRDYHTLTHSARDVPSR